MNLSLWAIAGICLLLLVVYIIKPVFLTLKSKAQTDDSEDKPNTGFWIQTTFSEPEAFSSISQNYEEQSSSWKLAMKQVCHELTDLNIGSVTLVHGTFVGTDPFDILRLCDTLIPGLSEKIKLRLKINKDQLFSDSGHFSKNYLNLIRQSMNPEVSCNLFEWSSGNHHIARVLGALDLLFFLTSEQKAFPKASKIILLIGHSHAGQLFALISQMTENTIFLKEINTLALEAGSKYSLKSVQDRIKKLTKRKIYFVTLGTPPRYLWKLNKKSHAMHLINHRLEKPEAGGSGGVLTTRDGDYVQQWGISGSDSLSPLKKHQALNKQLDQILDPGFNLNYWQSNLRLKKRIHSAGFNYLIDYGDNKKTPNCISTIFGHGIYTRSRVLLYNMKLITRHFSLIQQGFCEDKLSGRLEGEQK